MINLTIAGIKVNALTEDDAILIQPNKAKELIEQDNQNFRKVSGNEVSKHTKIMKDGMWTFNGDSISIDKNGLVKDGQHRLIACSRSNVPLKVIPVLIEKDMNIDDKKKLNFSAVLSGLGYHNTNTLSAITKVIYRKSIGTTNFYINKIEIDNNTLLEFFNKNQDIIDSMNHTTPYFRKCKVPHTLLATFFHITYKIDPNMARDFVRILADDLNDYKKIGITELNSIYHLKRMINKSNKVEKVPTVVITAWMIKAWNHWVQKTACKKLSWNCTGSNPEPFPNFVDKLN